MRGKRGRWAIVGAGLVAACSSKNPAQPTAAATATPVVISAPALLSPINGASAASWPAFVVTDAVRSGVATPLSYRFEIATNAAFAPILLAATVAETPTQTSFTPPASQPAPPPGSLFWRVTAIDPISVVSSPASSVQSFTWPAPPTAAALLAEQEGGTLWPGAQPPGAGGHAVLGNLWGVATLTSYDGIRFVSPELDELRVFDLLDRGLDPQSAIDWMHGNGYPTIAAYYPAVAVIGFQHEYMALVNGRWVSRLKVGA